MANNGEKTGGDGCSCNKDDDDDPQERSQISCRLWRECWYAIGIAHRDQLKDGEDEWVVRRSEMLLLLAGWKELWLRLAVVA